MKVIQALTANESDVRVICRDKWMVADWNEKGLVYNVYGRKKFHKHIRHFIETSSEDEAVAELIK